jgi:hypothetical protein
LKRGRLLKVKALAKGQSLNKARVGIELKRVLVEVRVKLR